jgi:lysine 6-dehydrogenase
MRFNAIVLGGGMVGSAIARDLQLSNYKVTVADRDQNIQTKLSKYGIYFTKLDFTDTNKVAEVIQNYDIVVGAVPGFLGYQIMKTVINSGKNLVDISFMPEDPRDLSELAKQKGVTIITDAGVAPGLSNLMFGNSLITFEQVNSAKCYVGGLPQNPIEPWKYKSVFSPIDVIEEYTRSARIVVNGEEIAKPAMTDIEQIYFENIGMLDVFNSDGLRTLVDLPIPNMIEKTMRFPGHIQKIIEMKDNGAFSNEQISKTSKSLIKEWTPTDTDYDQTIMRLVFSGIRNGESIIETYDLLDCYDKENSITSMARTTGYTCTAHVNLLLSKIFNKKGLFTLEELGQNQQNVDFVFRYLEKRNVRFNINIEKGNN